MSGVLRSIVKFAMAACLLIAGSTTALSAETLAELPPEERVKWPSVGVVTSRGRDGTVECSGILVAPDLVITAAHCTTNVTGLMNGLRFIAGLNGSRRVATSSAVEIMRHPAWGFASGKQRLQYDLAVLRLGRLIPSDKVQPAKLLPGRLPLPQRGVLLGYQKSAGRSLHGQLNCALMRRRPAGVVTSNCQVTDGNSGGAVMVQTEGAWWLAAVIAARQDPGGKAIAIAVNTWLRGLVSDAMVREEQRAQSALGIDHVGEE